jgi:hypothetical protein
MSPAAKTSGLFGSRLQLHAASHFSRVAKIIGITRLTFPHFPHFPQTRHYLTTVSHLQMAPSTLSGSAGVCIDAHQSRENFLVGTKPRANGDLNNTASMRAVAPPERNPEFAYRSLGLQHLEDDPVVRAKYRPFLLADEVYRSDWISRLELATVTELAYNDLLLTGSRLKVLVLYGSLRERCASSAPYPSHRR